MTDDVSHDPKPLQDTATRLRTLNRLNRLVSSSLAYEEVLGAIARAAADITATPCVSFWVVDADTRTIRIAAWSDPAMGHDFPTHLRRFGEGAIGLIAESARALHIPDVFAPDSLVTSRDWWRAHALTSFYGMPVSFGDTVLAVLALNGRAPFALSEEDHELLGSLVAQAAVAIRNAELFTQAEARRQAAEAAEMRYRELFERNIAAILRTTADGRIIECNDALVRILGYPSREALMARNVTELYVNPAEREPVMAVLLLRGRLTNAEFHWWRADRAVVTVLANIAVADDPVEGRILDALLIDITDRERLDAVEREAEALRVVARLANTAAHEINNPLAVIAGQLSLIEQRFKDNRDVAQRIEKARDAWKRITDLIAQMSRITRLELSPDTPGVPPLLDLRRSSEEP